MSRTYRRKHYTYFRHPQTENERSQLDEILNDPDLDVYPVGKRNRMSNRRGSKGLPGSYDDLSFSSN